MTYINETIVPHHIIAKRFIEAPNQAHHILPGALLTFEQAVNDEYHRLTAMVKCVVKFENGDPYSSCREMWEDVEDRGILKMKRYSTRFDISGLTYTRFRTVHDLHHCLLNLGFDYIDEYIACDIIIRALLRHVPDSYYRDDIAAIVRNEIIYGVATFNELGEFPEDLDNKFVFENLIY